MTNLTMHPASTLAGNTELKFSFLLMETFTWISMKILLKSKNFAPLKSVIIILLQKGELFLSFWHASSKQSFERLS